MIVFLLNLIFLAVSAVLDIITRTIFTAAVHIVVLAIHAFKLPGQAIQAALEQLGNAIRTCLDYLLLLVAEVASSFVSSLFDALKEGVSASADAAAWALGGLLDNTSAAVDGLIKDLAPQVVEGLTNFVARVAVNLWNNYQVAIGYVFENI